MTTTPPAPTLTGYNTADPCPRVEVLVTSMPVDAATITIYRSWRGHRSTVRDAVAAPVAGSYLVIDYEVPTGVAVSYSAVTADSGGVPSQESLATSITVDTAEVWFQDPLDPMSAMYAGLTIPRQVMVVFPSFMPASHPLPVAIADIVGSRLPVGSGGTRRAATGFPMTISLSTPDQAAQFRDLLYQSFPLAVRTPAAAHQFDGLMYLAIPDYLEEPDPGWVGSTFTFTAATVRGPGAGVAIQPRTYSDLLDEAATYSALLALYPTYVDVLRG